MTTRFHRAAGILCLLALAGVLPACQSGKGYGRDNSARSASWAADHVTTRIERDWEATLATFGLLPGATVGHVEASMTNLERTWSLYLYGTPGSATVRVPDDRADQAADRQAGVGAGTGQHVQRAFVVHLERHQEVDAEVGAVERECARCVDPE